MKKGAHSVKSANKPAQPSKAKSSSTQAHDNVARERVIRKTYTLLKSDLENIELIKDRCLNQKVVLNDSHAIRLALELAAKLNEDALVKATTKTIKIPTGRPKGS